MADQELPRARIDALAALFPAWDARWILFEDASVIAVDKPIGISTHAPDDRHRDDVVTRLGAFLRARGDDTYLGIHQRLDRDTSGVLVFARSKGANPSLAKQFEGRHVEKTYVAVVEGKLRLPSDGVLRDVLAPDRDGNVRVVERSARGKGQSAVTRVRVLERKSGRALVEARPETGRTHQIRAQLAHAGAPIVGDAAYGGAPHARLMLHARALELRHPISDRPLALSSPVDASFGAALRGEDRDAPSSADEVEALVRRAAERRYGVFASDPKPHAFRIAHDVADGLPGLSVDVYGDDLVAHLSDSPIAEEIVFDALERLGAARVWVKRRPKHASRIVDARGGAFAPRAPVRGASGPEAMLVEENGRSFEIRLGDGLSTGLFLDQRENRRRFGELVAGMRVLNLFAYTGSFSVVAAAGGARSTVTVDASASVCGWARRNLERASAGEPDHVVVEADCFQYLALAAKKGQRFDAVVLDPPSFSTTKTSRFSADGDYKKLAAAALRVVAPGGFLLACTNHRGIVTAKFRRFLHEAARDAGVAVGQMKDLPPPVDFPPPPGAESHLKSVLVRVA
ncbi:MAG: pseudouridine synthase [Polyangiaceae bacterium]